MRWLNNQVRFGLAAVVACGGAAYGAHLYQDQPQVDRAQAQQIRQLAERIRTQAPPAAVVLSPASLAPLRPIVISETEKPKVSVTPSVVAVKPAATKPQAPAPAAPVAPAVPVDPVKNIALMGVTQQGEAGRAWLVDLESHTREVVGEGEEAFGFTIKEIDDESVLLARGSETFNLRLGEKEIPTVASAAPESTETSGAPGGGPGGGDRGDRGDRRARFAALMSQMSNGGGRGSWGGRSWGGSSGGNWSNNSRGNWGNNGGSRWASNQGGRGFGGFSGGGFGGGNFGGGNFGGRNNQNSSMNRPTSNPQEARRRKSRLVGGANAIAEPDAFNNPQTQRRLGTTSGQAFGTGNNNQNRR